MNSFIAIYTPWLLSLNGIILTYLSGNKYRYVWLFGLGNMAIYFAWIFASQNWGFLPMISAMTVIYSRNHFKWNETSKESGGMRCVVVPLRDGTFEVQGRYWFWPFPVKLGYCCTDNDCGPIPKVVDTLEEANAFAKATAESYARIGRWRP